MFVNHRATKTVTEWIIRDENYRSEATKLAEECVIAAQYEPLDAYLSGLIRAAETPDTAYLNATLDNWQLMAVDWVGLACDLVGESRVAYLMGDDLSGT